MKAYLKQTDLKIQNYPKRWPEYLAFFLYLLINLIVGYFHEPFFDEAIAWEISRHSSLKDILFYVPHYEGHPPLWHLILMPFAKLGAPYEASLTMVSLIFTGTAMWILLFRSSFPRLVKLLLPFTFFLCYQHSVISRPYCVMMLAFVLLARIYHTKNVQPLRYVLCLCLLCATSAYGIILAGSLTLVWLLELWDGQSFKGFLTNIFSKKLFPSLLMLLAWALLLIADIAPYPDTFLDAIPITVHLPQRLLYTLLVLPADATCIQVFYYNTLLRTTLLDPSVFASGCLLGALILGMMIFYAWRKGTLRLLLIPYCLFGIFAASVYMNMHHMGIILFFLLFWLWVSTGTENVHTLPTPQSPESSRAQAYKWGRILSVGVCAYMMIMSLWWTCYSCVGDILKPYSNGRSMAAFIKEYHLDNYQIMAAWTKWIVRGPNGEPLKLEDIHHSIVYPILPYLKENIFCNGSFGMDGNYSIHKVPSADEIEQAFTRWRLEGAPDVLICEPDLKVLYGDSVSLDDYSPVYRQTYYRFWKSENYCGTETIYVRKELLEELGLDALPEENDNPFVF
ncbi:MAG: hypothetical protein IJ833_02670 [Lachnospiraceae bacterium]|nr:hypothetical protein [Lachnospiraceae bacterium]